MRSQKTMTSKSIFMKLKILLILAINLKLVPFFTVRVPEQNGSVLSIYIRLLN